MAGNRVFADVYPAADPSPEDQVFFRQRQRHLLAVVDALPLQDRQCLYLRSEGLHYREIAEILEISLGGVAKSLCRSMQRLANAENR
jgi:RNA polymerase sigma-70 factor (ECF subfamily)